MGEGESRCQGTYSGPPLEWKRGPTRIVGETEGRGGSVKGLSGSHVRNGTRGNSRSDRQVTGGYRGTETRDGWEGFMSTQTVLPPRLLLPAGRGARVPDDSTRGTLRLRVTFTTGSVSPDVPWTVTNTKGIPGDGGPRDAEIRRSSQRYE